MSEKKQTYTVLHDGGEDVGEKNVRPYETFQSVPSKEIDAKVEKGFLAKGELSAAEKEVISGKKQATPKAAQLKSKRRATK